MNSSRPLLTIGIVLVLLVILVLLVVRASKKNKSATLPSDTAAIEMIDAGLADVQQVHVELLESFPLQARAVVNGMISACDASLSEPMVSYSDLDKSFTIILGTEQPVGTDNQADCEAHMFTELIPLEITGFAAGEYGVAVNGVISSFVLDIDNEVGFELDKG